MASTASLRLRRNAAQIQALAGVQREIKSNDRQSRGRYLQDFAQAFRSYQAVTGREELLAAVAAADLVLIGDYHSLPASQRFAASLLEERAHSGERPVVLCVEAIFARDQHILDQWWRREIDEQELRRRIRYDLEWGYDWAPFYEVLVTAREHAYAIYGLDCMPRGGMRQAPLHDRHAAEKLGEICARHPHTAVMVLFGESHLAPGHLPRLLREKVGDKKVLTVLQNLDEIYWRAAGAGRETVESVRVSEHVWCAFNATPLEKYESYRVCLDRWGGNDPDLSDLSPTVYNLLSTLVKVLGFNQYAPHNGTQPKFLVDMAPEVYMHPSDAHLNELVRDRDEMEDLPADLEERGCVYVASRNTLYIREFRMAHASAEVARFLRHACLELPDLKGPIEPGVRDAACSAALEHCLAYFGSQILCPGPAEAPESDGSAALERLLLRSEIAEGNTPKKSSLRQLGCAMGRELYEAYLSGRVSKSFLRTVFMSDPASARETCKSIFRKVRLLKTQR
jgi:Haem-binding uptake, Tiki superfamily, ChaN